MTEPRRAQVSLKFIIVGGSVSGLASAYALQRAGHQVIVLEQTDGKYRSHGGVRSPPNMTKLLKNWGLGDVLEKSSVKCRQYEFLVGRTAEKIGVLKLHDELSAALQGDLLFLKHGDLQDMLLHFATQAGATVRYNTKVTRLDPSQGHVYVENGSKFSGDLIIGADGYKSIIRPIVVGPRHPIGVAGSQMSLNISIPTDLMREDKDLISLTERPEWTTWMGDGCAVTGYPMLGMQEYGIIAHLPTQNQYDEHWNHQYPMEELDFDFSIFEPRVQKMMKLARTFTPTTHVIMEPFDTWIHDSGKMIILGEAAHPSMPNGSHNQLLAVEDAATIGNLFSHLSHRSQIPLLLSAYEELRQPRCAMAQASERKNRQVISLPSGPAADARDIAFRELLGQGLLDWEHGDEKLLRATWDDYIQQFGYDANEAVDDWWTKWGSLVERGHAGATTLPPSPVSYEITVRSSVCV